MLGLLFGASVYTLSIILAVFLIGLGIGSGIGALLCRILVRPRAGLGLVPVAGCLRDRLDRVQPGRIAPLLARSTPRISSNIWFNFQLDLDRAFWALLPPTLLWGASFPLGARGGRIERAGCRPG